MKKKITAVILIFTALLLTLSLTSCDFLMQEIADYAGQELSPQSATTPDPTKTAEILSTFAERITPAPETPPTDFAQNLLTAVPPTPLNPFPYEFSGKDLYGNTVTQDSLGNKELYFVHFWGTWCPPCIAEMPDIGRLEAAYGDRVGFFALVDDYAENLSGTINIIESAGITEAFIMIDAYEQSAAEIFELVQSGYVPTTIIISNDEVVGPLIGAHFYEGYAEILDLLLDG